ncbi:MAG: prepilin-type N-terminal cleavage/methylation domain-containing protein [Armatimonadota bacterium]|nr:prepilin-type N-terminal cleavage/methylation domain-containing protein [Armatimonadota bacterium]MDR7428145.1 prepilin-type N-terminal cleavage/methylation domain-containing protein [Armatimonadota bacterium]MDR7463707.1 prepilin-type N-terminal cleavage/methylation domain-containing protein [Armatimonadota bacterium]MDR7473628.1 prepilin-type N-terminal cleavage/methylation domain-containing protein [Armatimonadota bacterium]MDR7538851.1 prepilin-type N-terminal cleavage/methylation domain
MAAVRGRAGFTIVEVLVALTLLATVVLLATRALVTVLTVTGWGGRVTVASALAARQMEAIRSRVEARPDRTSWRKAFCDVATQPPTALAPPHGAYSYRVTLNEQAVAASGGQEDLLLPCWSVEWPRAGCGTQPGYAPDCATDAAVAQDNRVRWVTVEVFFRDEDRPAARVTSALIRGAWHRE